MNQNQTPFLDTISISSHGTSAEGDGIFSHLDVGRQIGGGDGHETVAVVTIDGAVADALLLAQGRHFSGNLADALLLEIARFSDRMLAEALQDPLVRHGAGVVTVYGPGSSSCDGHPLALPSVPSAPGLDHAIELAAMANMAA
jgi:hypothetical protein